MRAFCSVLLLLSLLVGACASEEAAPPPADPFAACGTPDQPEGCPCTSTDDCWLASCCILAPGKSSGSCEAYDTFPWPACLPRSAK